MPDLPTGHLFDLTSLKRESGYTINDSHNRKIELNICAEAKSSCANGAGKHLILSDTVITDNRVPKGNTYAQVYRKMQGAVFTANVKGVKRPAVWLNWLGKDPKTGLGKEAMYCYQTPFLNLHVLTSSPIPLGLNGWVFFWM